MTIFIVSGYITDVLEDAKTYSNHAGRSAINLDDVKLAVQTQLDHSFTGPPPRDVHLCSLLTVAFTLRLSKELSEYD